MTDNEYMVAIGGALTRYIKADGWTISNSKVVVVAVDRGFYGFVLYINPNATHESGVLHQTKPQMSYEEARQLASNYYRDLKSRGA